LVRAGLAALALVAGAGEARSDAFDEYALSRVVQLPGAGPLDVLPDGRIIVLDLDEVFVETVAMSGQFASLGRLPGADIAGPEAAFLQVSPDGQRIAVGNNGGRSFTNFLVGVFELPALTGAWLAADHTLAAWLDDSQLALSAFGGVVTILNVDSPDPQAPDNTLVVHNIGGASAGVCFDARGRLYTGNGFALGGPSLTGTVKAFESSSWMPALSGGPPADFEADGEVVVVALSASPLGFDNEGNLFFGGGDFLADPPRPPFADALGLVRAPVVAAAAGGAGPADVSDSAQVRFLDPDVPADDFFAVFYNPQTAELYAKDFASAELHVLLPAGQVPLLSTGGTALLAALVCAAGAVVIHNTSISRSAGPPS
jgi:hypothetical protein